jgi:uncharacterized protein YdaU (DUF1376 family)
MHYFKRNIGDYHKKAGRLSMLKHGAYTLLIDACYDREKFPTAEEAIEWCWAESPEEIAAVEFVLRKFFVLTDGVYVQDRISEEIAKYYENAETNKRIAIEREAARKAKRERTEHEACTDGSRSGHEAPPNHKPLTINQEPLTNKDTLVADAPKAKRKTRLPADFLLTDERRQLAMKLWGDINRLDLNADTEFDKFITHHKAHGDTFMDWDACWRTWYCNAPKFNRAPLAVVPAKGSRHQNFDQIDYSAGVNPDGTF